MFDKTTEDKLRWELTMLHELLEDVDEVSPKTQEDLKEVATEIHRLLELEDADWLALGKRWRKAVLDFESRHPRLAQAVDEVTNMLANAGI